MSFLFSSSRRCDPFSLFPSINPAYGLPLSHDDSQETQSTEIFKDLDDQIFGRNTYCPTPTSFGDIVVSPSSSNSSDSFDSPSSSLLCSPPPERERFWLTGIENALSPIEDNYSHLEAPCNASNDSYRIEPLFDDDADRGIRALDVFSRESSLEIPAADLKCALFNAHKASSYYLQAPTPPSPLSTFNSSLPSPASSLQSFSDKSEFPSPISPGTYRPLASSGKSECSSPGFLGIDLPLSSSRKNECPSPLPSAIHPPLPPSRRLPLPSSSPSPSLSITSQMRHLRMRSHASSPPSPTFPRIPPYAGDLPARPEFPMNGEMSELEMRVIISILQATKTFGEWDFAKRGLPPLEKEVVSTQKTRRCGEERRSQTSCREIRCLIPGCGANFTALHNVKSHISSHYGVHDWVCEVCKSSFSHSGSLTRHRTCFCSIEKGKGLSRKRNSRRRNETSKNQTK